MKNVKGRSDSLYVLIDVNRLHFPSQRQIKDETHYTPDFHPALDLRQNGELMRVIGELDLFRGSSRRDTAGQALLRLTASLRIASTYGVPVNASFRVLYRRTAA